MQSAHRQGPLPAAWARFFPQRPGEVGEYVNAYKVLLQARKVLEVDSLLAAGMIAPLQVRGGPVLEGALSGGVDPPPCQNTHTHTHTHTHSVVLHGACCSRGSAA